MTKKILQLEIDRIRTNGGTQVRDKHDRDAISEYAMVTDQLPPVIVFWDGKEYWLADGFQRLLANLEAGNGTIQAEVVNGSQRDAILFALKANADGRGVRLTHADRAKGRAMLLNDPEWSQWSDKELARRFPHLGTDKTFGSVRLELAALAAPWVKDEPDTRAVCSKCGRRYAAGAIGRACDDGKCTGAIKCGISALNAKAYKTTRSGSGGQKNTKRHELPKAASAPSKKKQESDAAAFRERQLAYLDELGPVVTDGISKTERLKLKRTHAVMERMKLAIEADRRKILA